MCGIAGFTRFSNPQGSLESLRSMGDVIAHRGPDARGEYLDDHVGLCHRRLSIIDLSAAGTQPMSSADGDQVLVYNGEVYNFPSLRRDLATQGYVFKTRTDTEVILALYRKLGFNFLDKLNGMFAFALWDKPSQTLYLARDRLGKKPLYYYRCGADVVFASEIKSILQLPQVPRLVRDDAVCDFFAYQYVPDPKTIFQDIYKVKPGCWLEVTSNSLRETQYWDLSFDNQSGQSEQDLGAGLEEILEKSTQDRMISDVPLGAFLSGGVDSSAIVGLTARNRDEAGTTCAVGVKDKAYDEVVYASKVAKHFQTKHHELQADHHVAEGLRSIARYFDEPFADQSFVPTYLVSQMARKKVTVALSGDGGDENFAGYQKYSVDQVENTLRSLFPSCLRASIFPTLAHWCGRGKGRFFERGESLLNTLSRDSAQGFFLSNCFFDRKLWDQVIQDDYRCRLAGYDPAQVSIEHYQQADAEDHLSRVLYTDIKTYLTGDILVKVDRMSMANSLEVRAPLLDYRVVEYAASIPSALKYHKGEKKYILKKSFSNLLPAEILYRKKMGFSVPLAQWLRRELRPLAEQCLFRSDAGLARYFKVDQVRNLWDKLLQGECRYAQPLWSMLMFELWWQVYVEGIQPELEAAGL